MFVVLHVCNTSWLHFKLSYRCVFLAAIPEANFPAHHSKCRYARSDVTVFFGIQRLVLIVRYCTTFPNGKISMPQRHLSSFFWKLNMSGSISASTGKYGDRPAMSLWHHLWERPYWRIGAAFLQHLKKDHHTFSAGVRPKKPLIPAVFFLTFGDGREVRLKPKTLLRVACGGW